MALTARYLADKSALAEVPGSGCSAATAPAPGGRLDRDVCIVDLEVLYSSRSLADYEAVLEERRSLDVAPIDPEVMTPPSSCSMRSLAVGSTAYRSRTW